MKCGLEQNGVNFWSMTAQMNITDRDGFSSRIDIFIEPFVSVFSHCPNLRDFKILDAFSSVCVLYVCLHDYSQTVQPRTFSFGITFRMWIYKNDFIKFYKKSFCAELLPFFYISLRFLCNFEEQLRKKHMEIRFKLFLHVN